MIGNHVPGWQNPTCPCKYGRVHVHTALYAGGHIVVPEMMKIYKKDILSGTINNLLGVVMLDIVWSSASKFQNNDSWVKGRKLLVYVTRRPIFVLIA